jgi:hypothetical protein
MDWTATPRHTRENYTNESEYRSDTESDVSSDTGSDASSDSGDEAWLLDDAAPDAFDFDEAVGSEISFPHREAAAAETVCVPLENIKRVEDALRTTADTIASMFPESKPRSKSGFN